MDLESAVGSVMIQLYLFSNRPQPPTPTILIWLLPPSTAPSTAGGLHVGQFKRLRRAVIHKSTEDFKVKRCYYDISKECD